MLLLLLLLLLTLHKHTPIAAPLQISDPTKLKRMSKKQLRTIKRTRVNAQGITEVVGAYAK